MQEFLRSVEAVSVILLLTATGYFCAAMGWFKAKSKAFVSKFLMSIAAPSMCVYGLRTHLTQELLSEAGAMLLIPLICISTCFLLSYLVGKLLKLPRRTFGVFMMMCGLSNTFFIGYPMCTALFGDVCIPYLMTYYVVSTSFTQAVGTSLVRWSGETEPFSLKMLLRFFRMPTMIGIVVGILIVAFDIQLPELVMSYGEQMSHLVTPLALLVTGEIIHEIGLRKIHIDKCVAIVLSFRFLFAPFLCFSLCRAFGVSGLANSVFVIQSAMPTVSQTVIAASEYGADESLAAQGAAVTTIASFAVIPILMVIL